MDVLAKPSGTFQFLTLILLSILANKVLEQFCGRINIEGSPLSSWYFALFCNCLIYPFLGLFSLWNWVQETELIGEELKSIIGERSPEQTPESLENHFFAAGLTYLEWLVVEHINARMIAEILQGQCDRFIIAHHMFTFTFCYAGSLCCHHGQRLFLWTGIFCEFGSGAYGIWVLSRKYYSSIYLWGMTASNTLVISTVILYRNLIKNNIFIMILNGGIMIFFAFCRQKSLLESLEIKLW